jgi:hypothetical protein
LIKRQHAGKPSGDEGSVAMVRQIAKGSKREHAPRPKPAPNRGVVLPNFPTS